MDYKKFLDTSLNANQIWLDLVEHLVQSYKLQYIKVFEESGEELSLEYSYENPIKEFRVDTKFQKFHLDDINDLSTFNNSFTENDQQFFHESYKKDVFNKAHSLNNCLILKDQFYRVVFCFHDGFFLWKHKRELQKHAQFIIFSYHNYKLFMRNRKVLQKVYDNQVLNKISKATIVSNKPILQFILDKVCSALHFDFCYLINAGNKTVLSQSLNAKDIDVFSFLEIDSNGVQVISSVDIIERGYASILILPVDKSMKAYLVMLVEKNKKIVTDKQVKSLEYYYQLLIKYLNKKNEIKNFIKKYEELLLDLINVYEAHSNELVGHHNRVALFTNLIAKKINMKFSDRMILVKAAKLHDIGMLNIQKDNNIIADNFNHPVVGSQVFSDLSNYAEVSDLILKHHENCQGYGYPQSLKLKESEVSAQILSLVEYLVEFVFHNIKGKQVSIAKTVSELTKSNLYSEKVQSAAVDVLKSIEIQGKKQSICKSMFGARSRVCQGCPALNSKKRCWEFNEDERNCINHGCKSCKDCIVFKTWGGTS